MNMTGAELIKKLLDIGDLDREVALLTRIGTNHYEVFNIKVDINSSNNRDMILLEFENETSEDIVLPSSLKERKKKLEEYKQKWIAKWDSMTPQEKQEWSNKFKF